MQFGFFSDDSKQLGFTAFLLTALSVFLILVTVPFSLCLVIKVSQISIIMVERAKRAKPISTLDEFIPLPLFHKALLLGSKK